MTNNTISAMNSGMESLEMLKVGAKWRSTSRTLTEAELVQACMTSGDWHPVHADAEYASSTTLGKRIFHGTYGLHIAIGMAGSFPDIGSDPIALGFADWRYVHPLCIGDTVHVEVEVVGKRTNSDGKRAIIERRIELVRGDATVLQQGLAKSIVQLLPMHELTGSGT